MSDDKTVKDEAPRITWTWLLGKPQWTAFLAAALSSLILVLAAASIWTLPETQGALFRAQGEAVFQQGQWWRLWTALFAHADMGHLLSNLLLFFTFGYLLNGYFGLFVFPTAAILSGGLINVLVLLFSPPQLQILGMSGVVYWMGGAWLTLYVLLSRHLSPGARWLRSFGVALMIFMPTEAFNPQISYTSHGIGFGLGVFFGFFYFLLRKNEFRRAERVEAPQSELLDFDA